jgi:transposase
MRGNDRQQNHIFSYLPPEQRVRKDRPLRAIRAMMDEVLKQLSPRFDTMYAKLGRPSIPPEQLLRARLLPMLYSVRSERLLMEEIDYNLLFRWFVGLNADDEAWDATVFTKNRDRLLEADVAKEFLAQVVAQARTRGLTEETDRGMLRLAEDDGAVAQARHRGTLKVEWIFACAACNLVRMRNLLAAPVAAG